MIRPLTAALLLMALAACNQAKEQTSAGGEILEGSASDAMLPLDTVRSQAPVAPRAQPSGEAEEAGDTGTEAAATPSEAAPAAPAAAPSAEPSPAE